MIKEELVWELVETALEDFEIWNSVFDDARITIPYPQLEVLMKQG